MEGPERRFVKFGGGASEAQLAWLRGTLAAAAAEGQRVILCCHLALHPGTCPGACLLWNYEEVLEACWQAGNVVATFAGHAHEVIHLHRLGLFTVTHHFVQLFRLSCSLRLSTLPRVMIRGMRGRPARQHIIPSNCWLQDGYAVDDHGVHHRVLSAVVETAPGRDCFGIVSVYSDRLELQGYDRMASATMRFPTQQKRAGKENAEQALLGYGFASQPKMLVT